MGDKDFLQLGNFENARDSTTHPHSRSTRPVGKRCARRNVLVRSPSGERGCSSHTYHVVYLQQRTLKPTYFFPPFKNQDKTGNIAGVQNQLFDWRSCTMTGCISRGHHGEGVVIVGMLISAAGEGLSSTAPPVKPSAKLAQRQQTTTGVLADTDPNLLNCGSTAVAHTTSYCWRPVDAEVRVCGDEHSSGCLLPLAHIAEFWSYCHDT